MKYTCTKCQSNTHDLTECRQLAKLNFAERRDYVHNLGLCFGCFKADHQIKNCNERKVCSKCGGNHPTCFHRNQSSQAISHTSSNNEITANTVSVNHCPSITSMIVPVYVYTEGSSNDKILTYALLETQSDTSFIDSKLAQHLGGGAKANLTILHCHRAG